MCLIKIRTLPEGEERQWGGRQRMLKIWILARAWSRETACPRLYISLKLPPHCCQAPVLLPNPCCLLDTSEAVMGFVYSIVLATQ